MENLPTWPDTIFSEETLKMEHTGLPSKNQNDGYISKVKTWIDVRLEYYHDIVEATEIIQMGLENADEFLKLKNLSDSDVTKLKKQCEEFDTSMDEIASKIIKHKSENFTKKFPQIGQGAKENIKEEFNRLTKYIQNCQKVIKVETARILSEKEKQEAKPIPTQAPAAQASGGTTVIEVSRDPMNSYNPMIWKDCKLTLKTDWIEYLDWKRKIDNHFNYVEKLASLDVHLRVI